MQNITRFALITSVAVVGACAPSTDAPVARFGGSFDPGTGALQIVTLEGDDVDVEQALLQKVEVDGNNGVADDAPLGTVEVRNGNGPSASTVSTVGGAGGDAAGCGASATDAALVFGLRVYNNVADFNPLVIRMDTVAGGVDTFCHLAGRTDVTGIQRQLLGSYNFGVLAQDSTSSNNLVGTAPVGRRIIAHFSGVPAPFTFTGSVFGDF